MATTFLTISFSLKSIGNYWPSVIALFLADYLSITAIGVVCMVISAFYQIFLWRKIVPLEDKQPKEYKIDNFRILTFYSFGFYIERVEDSVERIGLLEGIENIP